MQERTRHRQDVATLLHDRDAADDFAVAVEVSDAAPKVVSDLDVADIFEVYRLAGHVAPDHEELELVHALGANAAAQLVLAVCHLDRASSGFLERASHGGQHAVQRHAALAHQRREQLDLILLLESADRRDFSDSSSRLQRRLDEALVQKAKLAQVADALPVEQRILKDPTHAARVRADRDVRVGWELRSDGIKAVGQILPHDRPAAWILEDHVHERVPHMRGTANRLNVGRAGQCPDHRFGDLRFDDLRAARPLGVDDDLRIRDVRDGIQRGRAECVHAESSDRRHETPHEPAESDDVFDDCSNHACSGPLQLVLRVDEEAADRNDPLSRLESLLHLGKELTLRADGDLTASVAAIRLLHVHNLFTACLENRLVWDRQEFASFGDDFQNVPNTVLIAGSHKRRRDGELRSARLDPRNPSLVHPRS